MDTGTNMNYNLNFHQTFKPEREYIASLISFKNLSDSKEAISHRFGIPTGKSSGKVEVNLYYAQAAGLLEFFKKNGLLVINRTQLGDVVYSHDNFLEHEMTQLYFHYMYCSNTSSLVLWKLLFTSFRNISQQFNIQDFQDFATKKFSGNNIKTAPLVGTYVSDNEPLVNLGLLQNIDKQVFKFGKIDILSTYYLWYTYFVYYQLLSINKLRSDFTLDDLLNTGFMNIFGWESNQLRWLLELIESKGYLFLNKQFENYHIHLNYNINDLISELYS
jgi:hypothetical protein